MKITKARLKEIIREEMNKLVATGEISIDEAVLDHEDVEEGAVEEQTDKDIADRTPGDKPKDRKKPAS